MNFFGYFILFLAIFATAMAKKKTTTAAPPDPTTACGPCLAGETPDCPPNTYCYTATQECYPNTVGGSCF